MTWLVTSCGSHLTASLPLFLQCKGDSVMNLHEALIEHEESNPRKTGQLTINILQLLAEEDEEEND